MNGDKRRVAEVTLDQVRRTYKARDSWWTVLLVDPLAARLVRLIVGRTWLTPTRLTVLAFAFGLAAAIAFLQAGPAWLVAGAAIYYASFLVDCVDGKIARLRGEGSIVGSWLDFVLDRVRVAVATAALFGGQFLATGSESFLLVAIAVVFLSLFGYLNGAEIDRAKQHMARLAGEGQPPGTAQPPAGDSEKARLPVRLSRLRDALHRRRIRMNVVSGVEFDMALFVVAPLAAAAFGPGALIVVALVVGALLIAFELALVTRFWLAARSFDRQWRQSPVPSQRVLHEPEGHRPVER